MLVELNKISDVSLVINTQPVTHDMHNDSEEMTINPTIIKIDSQATFNPSLTKWNVVATSPNTDARSRVRDGIIDGDLLIEEVSDSQKIITTPEFEQQYEAIP
ncbi:hypothetical protein ERJ77_26715, partial [Vibrio anguillarum]|nr:hypothetical protein [Vibrio anguillarum]